jgi:predicted O-methyltransferase YrrM
MSRDTDTAETPAAQRPNTLRDRTVAEVLDRLHRAARRDWRHMPRVLPYFLLSKVTGRSLMQVLTPSMLSGMYIPVSRQDGQLLYATARGIGATRVVEFGTSFGISAIYLAAAVRDNGGGQVITTEIEPAKCRAATANIAAAGLDAVAEVLEGDALHTLKDVEGPVDLLFLDGWKDLYVPVLDLLTPKLRPGALVVADNINFPDTRPYLARIRNSDDFVSTPLPSGRTEFSWYVPARTPTQ